MTDINIGSYVTVTTHVLNDYMPRLWERGWVCWSKQHMLLVVKKDFSSHAWAWLCAMPTVIFLRIGVFRAEIPIYHFFSADVNGVSRLDWFPGNLNSRLKKKFWKIKIPNWVVYIWATRFSSAPFYAVIVITSVGLLLVAKMNGIVGRVGALTWLNFYIKLQHFVARRQCVTNVLFVRAERKCVERRRGVKGNGNGWALPTAIMVCLCLYVNDS